MLIGYDLSPARSDRHEFDISTTLLCVRSSFVRSSFVQVSYTPLPTHAIHLHRRSLRPHCAPKRPPLPCGASHSPRWEHLIPGFTRTQEAKRSTKSGQWTTVNLSPSSHPAVVSLATQRQRRTMLQALSFPPPNPTSRRRTRRRRSSPHSTKKSPTPLNVPTTILSDSTA